VVRQLGFILRQQHSIASWTSAVARFWVAAMTFPSDLRGAASSPPEAGTAEIGCRSSAFALVGDVFRF
jgi:hypothetical protein